MPRKRLTPALSYFQQKLMEQEGYSPSFKTIEEFLEYLIRNLKKPIFFDEISNFQYIDPSTYSILQSLLDKHDVQLIVTGSYVGIMKRVFTLAKEPLFGQERILSFAMIWFISWVRRLFMILRFWFTITAAKYLGLI